MHTDERGLPQRWRRVLSESIDHLAWAVGLALILFGFIFEPQWRAFAEIQTWWKYPIAIGVALALLFLLWRFFVLLREWSRR
jgi:TRAP-type C4-dicarboxylate transport system permease small subunit